MAYKLNNDGPKYTSLSFVCHQDALLKITMLWAEQA